jgi:transaldolase/glucose-6-phosphate isomerase
MITASYGKHSLAIGEAIADARVSELLRRIKDRDHTVWQEEPDGIQDRLGWLRAPATMEKALGRVERFAGGVREAFDDVLLIGMGGSSLAAAAFAEIFGDAGEAPRLRVVDTTDPDFIAGIAASTDPLRTLHIVATKSGTTVETRSAFRFFWTRVADALRVRADGSADTGEGADPGPAPGTVGERFAAITDPNTPLAHLARDRGFRDIFLNPADVGGRFSALTLFGLVPATIAGAPADELLERGGEAAEAALAGRDGRALQLGVALGVLAAAGRDKLTLTTSPAIAPFADWIEQLIAESTGKGGTGILPVVGEPLGPPDVYGEDRVFVDLLLPDDDARDHALAVLERAGHPVVRLALRDLADLGAQVMVWELATAVAAARLGVNPFDQPDVEAAKARAAAVVEAFRAGGEGSASPAVPPSADALAGFLGEPAPGGYVALQAFVTPSEAASDALLALRLALRDRQHVATTAGYGPRFLHSTGQLHKGDGGRGLFVQLVSEPEHDVAIPDSIEDGGGAAADEPPGPTAGEAEGGEAKDGGDGADQPATSGSGARALTFGALRDAQAVGDRSALEEAGRRVITFALGRDVVAGIRALAGEPSD